MLYVPFLPSQVALRVDFEHKLNLQSMLTTPNKIVSSSIIEENSRQH